MKIILKAVFASVLIILVGSFVPAQEAWDRNHEACDTDGPSGALCAGLASFFRLDEPADYTTRGGGLFECLGTDVATSTTARWGLARSASFDGSNLKGLVSPGAGGFGGGSWTVAVWVYPTSATVTSTLLSTMSAQNGKQGLAFDLYYTGSALNARARSYMQDTDTILTVTNTVNISPNAWHLVVFRSGHSTIRKLYATQALSVSVDGGAFTSTAWTNSPRTNSTGHMVIGRSHSDLDRKTGACLASAGGFTGYMQGLAFYARVLTSTDLALFYNGGAGRDFPFSN